MRIMAMLLAISVVAVARDYRARVHGFVTDGTNAAFNLSNSMPLDEPDRSRPRNAVYATFSFLTRGDTPVWRIA